jgi:hypothetical protein
MNTNANTYKLLRARACGVSSSLLLLALWLSLFLLIKKNIYKDESQNKFLEEKAAEATRAERRNKAEGKTQTRGTRRHICINESRFVTAYGC